MPIPQHMFDLGFNIIRSSNAVREVRDLRLSGGFFETTIGLHIEDAYDDVPDRRGSKEHQHHALLLRKAGARFDPPRYLKPDDVVEVEADGIGQPA